MNPKNCYTGVNIEQIENECGNNFLSTSCTQTPNAISYLDLPAGSSQTEINAALTASLLFKDQQIAEFSSTIIEAGDNIEITGVGSEENPYIISSSGGASDLQSVLDSGTYAEVDNGDSYVELLEPYGAGGKRVRFWIDNPDTTGFSEFQMHRNISLLAFQDSDNRYRGFQAYADGIGMFDRISNILQTYTKFQTPLANTVLSFPAKINNGDYTIPAYPNTTYLVSTLPAGQLNDIAVVTDATTPTYLGALSGGGTTVTPVWHNGTIWVAR